MSIYLRSNSVLVRLLWCGALTFMAQAQTTRVDLNGMFRLAGNTRPEANAENDRGKVPDSFAMPHMLLQLQRSPEREQTLRNFMEQQQDSTSPNFHRWLTAIQFGQIYGPSPRDIETVSEWLSSSGFTVNTVYPSGMLLDFSGTAGQGRFWGRSKRKFTGSR
jgi:hypothetical protein